MWLNLNRRVSLRVILVIAAMICCITFQNCSEFSATTSMKQNSLTSQCLDKLREKPLPSFDAKSVCEDVGNYRCDRRVFRPGLENGDKSEVTCIDVDGWGNTCIEVNVLTYDTSVAREPAGGNDAEFAEGGEYNREEVSCANTKVRSGDLTLINANGDSLENALSEALRACRNGSRL